ncbi:MAG: hypothetical protein ACLUKN_00115 [Bacilli bacterium]
MAIRDEDDVNRIIGDNKRDIKLSAMADAEKCDYKTDIVEKSKASGYDKGCNVHSSDSAGG